MRPFERASHAGGAEGEHSRFGDAPSFGLAAERRRGDADEDGAHIDNTPSADCLSCLTVQQQPAERERSLGMDPFSLLLIVLIPLIPIWVIWVALFLANDPTEEIRKTQHAQFLGPGGPDDPFADEPFDY